MSGAAMLRSVEADPRVGDVVRVLPKLTDAPAPPPITITAVDEQRVHWRRGSDSGSTCRKFWSGARVLGGSRMQLALIDTAAVHS